MKAVICYRITDVLDNLFFAERLYSAFEKRGAAVKLLLVDDNNSKRQSIAELLRDKNINFQFLDSYSFEKDKPDAMINRIPNATVSAVAMTFGVRVFNNEFVSNLLNDKYATYQFVEKWLNDTKRDGLPCFSLLKTLRCESQNDALVLGFPVVLKNPCGRGGNEVFLARNREELCACFKKGFICQPYIEAEGDLRVYVLGGKAVAAVVRRRGTDFRANVKQGGSAVLVKLDESLKLAAEQLAIAWGADYVGVDFLCSQKGYIFNEGEDCVGARSLYSLSDIDIADMFCDYVLKSILKEG